MAKRKAGVNDIIYELDNDDIEISSEDEVKEPKINRLELNIIKDSAPLTSGSISGSIETSLNGSPVAVVDKIPDAKSLQNGGKTSPQAIVIDSKNVDLEQANDRKVVDNDKITQVNDVIYNEDMDVNSPASNSDPGVVGCENRTPLVTIKFKDNKLAKAYKDKIKKFMLNLIKLHEDNFVGSDNDTDLELDVWPEDLSEEQVDLEIQTEPEEQEEDSLFFIDTDPTDSGNTEIPRYRQNATILSNIPKKEPSPSPTAVRKGPSCFNCDGAHPLRDCPLPRNNMRIAEKRKNLPPRLGRYHVEDDQKYGHLIPGRISQKLRLALGLNRNEIPLHVYRMRVLGYPPGWLEEARISHSGINMFDSSGRAIQDPEEEEGEVAEPGSKDKFDIKKILDFPGFNVPTSSRYKEEAHKVGLPPMSEQDSKMAMLQMLAPNAMKAYKRKKLSLLPSSESNNTSLVGPAEMELDSGDEATEFPSVPPLPDEAPPAPPPPPPPCPPDTPASPPPCPPDTPASPPPCPPDTPASPPPCPPDAPASPDSHVDKVQSPAISPGVPSKRYDSQASTEESSDVEVIDVMAVTDIPVPVVETITIDEDELSTSGRDSPSLDDLEEKKKLLLDALKGDSTLDSTIGSEHILDTVEIEELKETEINDPNINNVETEDNNGKDEPTQDVDIKSTSSQSTKLDNIETGEVKTPEAKIVGHVKATSYGTPVLNIISPYVTLPSDDKFAKDICDVINFENLPNSTGKYKKISGLLKKVKSEVDRIQDS